MNSLEILPGIWATPYRFLWLSESRTAVVADLHVSALPLGEAMRAAWSQLLRARPEHVILAGDVMDQAQPHTRALLHCRELLAQLPSSCRVTLTPGNHDPSDLGEQLTIQSHLSVRCGDCVVSHGHNLPQELSGKRSLTWIVGHQHPALILRSKAQSAKMAAYALCRPASDELPLLLLPAFNRDAGGPLGCNLAAGTHWLLPVARPRPQETHIFGIIEPSQAPPQVLDFGTLAHIFT